MGKIYKVETVKGISPANLSEAEQKGDVVFVPETATQLTIEGGLVEMGVQEDE